MAYRLTGTVLAGLLALGLSLSSAQNPTLKTTMREKLVHAQQLLEAVVAADFGAIERSTVALGRISDTEINAWQPGSLPEYRRQAALFTSSVRRLREAAAKRDIDAALAEYAAMVSSCARCHAQAGKARVITFELRPPH
jgi:cytochrome c553